MAPTAGQAAKRKHDVVDLTFDDGETDDEQPAKAQKGAADFNAKRQKTTQQTASASNYQTPPASSQGPPSSSAPSNSQRTSRYDSNAYTITDQQHSQDERNAWLATQDGDSADIDEIVSSTQAAADNDELQLYGDLPTKIVGVQYYRGIAMPGEYILMRREPGNPYDSNAIRIDNVAGRQIGHIPRRMAEKLAKYMDHGWVCFEGRLAGGIGQFDCPLEVNILGPDPTSDAGKALVAKMAADKLPTKALKEAERREKQREKERQQAEKRRQQEDKKRLLEARRAAASGSGQGGRVPTSSQGNYANLSTPGPSTQPVMEDILEASQRINTGRLTSATDDYGRKENVLAAMPMATKPDKIGTTMLPYQLQALRWMLDQESPQPPPQGSKKAVQLWKRHDTMSNTFTNIATSYSTKDQPVLASGGILADDMGLGKTLEVISLIVADGEKFARGTTLICCPLSVISNWTGQIAHHVIKDKPLAVYVYHGSGRVQMRAEDLSQYDVVITTYQTLASDFMPRGKGAKAPERKLRATGLYSTEYRRIVLDEGHIVRNPASKGAAAVMGVMARSRWVLTGTPIINSLKDLYCLLKFVGITGGLETLQVFNGTLVRPLKKHDTSAVLLLEAIMTAFTLRRTKSMKFIDLKLPNLEEWIHRVQFTDKERERYIALYNEAKGLSKIVGRNTGQRGESRSQVYQHLLEVLLRMRQCCNHWQLCGERVTKLLEQLEQQTTVDLTPENKKALQDILSLHIQSQEDCPVCLESLKDPVITTCGHFFGLDCIQRVIETQGKCPMCRAELKDESMLVHPANDGGDEEKDDQMDLTASSSKLEAMMHLLHATKNADGPTDKTIIFSQWTRFLDIVQARLDREGFKYCRLDGTMSAQERESALEALENDPECTIMLASLSVCAVGLNLTAANQVILSDSWWAPAIEDQAVDRVHRLGQKKECRVIRLVMDGSVEEDTLAIQKDKRELMKLAFQEKDGKRDKAKSSRGVMADIGRLLARDFPAASRRLF